MRKLSYALSLLTLVGCESAEAPPVVETGAVPVNLVSAVDPVDIGRTTAGSGGLACGAYGTSLGEAFEAFIDECPNSHYRDCDRAATGEYVCASVVLGAQGPGGEKGNVDSPTADSFLASLGGTDGGQTGGDTGDPAPVPDPAPTPDPDTGSTGAVVLTVEAESQSSPGWQFIDGVDEDFLLWTLPDNFNGSASREGLKYTFTVVPDQVYKLTFRSRIHYGLNSTESNDAFLRVTEGAVVSPTGVGSEYIKVFQNLLHDWNTALAYELHGPVRRGSPIKVVSSTDQLAIEIAGRSHGYAIDSISLVPLGSAQGGGGTPPLQEASDLLFLHYDAAPDPDDLMAMLAGKAVASRFAPDLVVVGAYGHARGHQYISRASNYVSRLYPSIGRNAHTNRGAVLAEEASALCSTVTSGNTVYIADGGPMDYTADLLRTARGMCTGFAPSSVIVVQHSHGWNEDNTSAANLAYVQSNATYRKIGNGNNGSSFGGIDSADLNEPASSAGCKALLAAGAKTPYADLWIDAANSLADSRKCDFSDTVEYLHIIGDSVTQNVTAFVSKYMQ